MQRYTHHVSKVVLCGSGAKNLLVKIAYPLARFVTMIKGRNTKAGILNTLMFKPFSKSIPDRRTDYDWLSYNEENVDKYIDDPLCGFGPNNGFCVEFLKGMNRLYRRKFLEKIRKDLDIFIISGKDDPVSNYAKDVEKLEKMYKKYKLINVQTKVYEGMRHEILNEVNREEVYKDVVAFFKHELDKKNVV
jgi:alpha-beta hydrolase superfamily lysophospholipase